MKIMRITFLVMSLMAMGLALISGCSPGDPAAAQEGTLIVGCDTNFMPFEFERDGEYVGFDIDLWRALAEDMGVDFKLQPMDFNGLIPALQTGGIDAALAGMTIKAEREKVVDFSYPYYQAGLLLMVHAENTAIHSIRDLDDKTVATKLGTTSADFAKAANPGDLKLFPNIDGAYLEMQAGGADAVIFDSPAILYYIKTSGKEAVKTVGPLYQGQSYGIAFPQGSPLRERVDIALLGMMEDGRYDALYAKWFGQSTVAGKTD